MTWSTSDVAVCCSNASVRSVCTLPQFVEQPRVLDGDDRLGGEARDECDLPVGEGATSRRWMQMMPISTFSLSMGTAMTVRMPPS